MRLFARNPICYSMRGVFRPMMRLYSVTILARSSAEEGGLPRGDPKPRHAFHDMTTMVYLLPAMGA